MLSRIHIQNIGIIEDIEIEFDNKINVLTGETGSGKTLIVDSISLVTGNRVTKDIIRNGKDSAFIEVCFIAEIPDVSEDGMVILSRQIFTNGKTVCKVNGKMATLTMLKDIGDTLIDIHGQHDTIYLLNQNMYMNILDSYIGKEIEVLNKEYTDLLNERKKISIKKKELCADPIERQRKIEMLEYQLKEIDNSKLQIGEEEELTNQKTLFKNYERIYSNLNESYNVIDNNVLNNLQSSMNKLSNISSYDKKYEELFARLQEIYYNIEDCNSQMSEELSKMEFDPEEQQRVVDRLDEIFSMKRKYGQNIEEVLKYREKIKSELEELTSSDDIIKELNKQYLDNKEQVFSICLKMHNTRNEKAQIIQTKVNKELQDLEMKKAKFNILLSFNNNIFEYDETKEYEFNEDGLDKVEFNICTNVGSKPQSIGKIASGGELSRLTLALKTVLVDSYNIPTIIFDEIDTGLSGQACISLADKFKLISKKHQILLITHHPNIAAIGTTNIYVSKNIKNGLTVSNVKVLDNIEKIKEIARILNGNSASEIALKHAEELVDLNKN